MKSDEETLTELAADQRKWREENPHPSATVKKFAPRLSLDGKVVNAPISDEEKKQRDMASRVNGFTNELISARGARYRNCTITNFGCSNDEQAKAVERLTGYCRNMEANAKSGLGVFLFGGCGTGKDHLAMGVAKAFIAITGKSAMWISGAMLFEKLRDSFDGKKSEGEILSRYASTPLLWLSDPIPVKGELTQYQAEALYRLVDERYNNRRPVLVTANIEAGTADSLMGPAIARRLRESTLQVHCNWPGHKPA